MKSYQNLSLLQNLYRMKMAGFEYIDPIVINKANINLSFENMLELSTAVSKCHLCDLSKSRSQSMSGEGNIYADVMIVDASVSDIQNDRNSYFVGKSGEILEKMVENVLGLKTSDIYITHIAKCKPLGANKVSSSEYNSCKPYLLRQIELINPTIIIVLGDEAYRVLSEDTTPFENIRGQKIKFMNKNLVTIHHPQHLLRNPSLKKETLYDLQMIKSFL
ncbi:MAG: uracil-DNA glycosylase [Helicobacteraceae bacterium]|nr:uracil-DNA glycosylase [Helicobacteraceae bacterium]